MFLQFWLRCVSHWEFPHGFKSRVAELFALSLLKQNVQTSICFLFKMNQTAVAVMESEAWFTYHWYFTYTLYLSGKKLRNTLTKIFSLETHWWRFFFKRGFKENIKGILNADRVKTWTILNSHIQHEQPFFMSVKSPKTMSHKKTSLGKKQQETIQNPHLLNMSLNGPPTTQNHQDISWKDHSDKTKQNIVHLHNRNEHWSSTFLCRGWNEWFAKYYRTILETSCNRALHKTSV